MRHYDATYYAKRAREYEVVYSKPERQVDLQYLRERIPTRFAGRSVLEVACGTGYWTQFIAQSARIICATDLTEETLAIARGKNIAASRALFKVADAMALPADLGTFDSAFCGFWWSHLAHAQIDAFIASLHARLVPGATVLLLDNRYVEGSSTPISRRTAEGDTYQLRHLANGSNYDVLKNFPSEEDIRTQLRGRAINVQYTALQYYWLVEYQCAA